MDKKFANAKPDKFKKGDVLLFMDKLLSCTHTYKVSTVRNGVAKIKLVESNNSFIDIQPREMLEYNDEFCWLNPNIDDTIYIVAKNQDVDATYTLNVMNTFRLIR